MKFIFLTNVFQSLKILVSTTASSGMTVTKLIAGFKIGLFLSPMVVWADLQNWALSNVLYINLVMMAIFFDWLLGSLKHWLWTQDFHWRENIKGIVVKSLLVLVVGAIFEGLKYLTREASIVITYLTMILRLTVFLYPAMSIIRSSRIISDGKFPPAGIYNAIEKWAEELGNKQEKHK